MTDPTKTALPRRTATTLTEAGIVALALFVLTYLYVLSGLAGVFLPVVYPALFVGTVVGVAVTTCRSTATAVAVSAVLVPAGLALAGVSVGTDGLRGPALVVLLAGGAVVATAPEVPRRTELSLVVAGLGLALLFGAFPRVGSGLLGTPPFQPITLDLVLASEMSTVFGVRTPELVFGAPTFSASVHLLQAAGGATTYALGRTGQGRTDGG